MQVHEGCQIAPKKPHHLPDTYKAKTEPAVAGDRFG